MGKILSLIFLTFILNPFLLKAGEIVSFSIEKTTYDGLSSTQKENINTKIVELNDFFIQDVYPQIPISIFNKIQNLKVTINFNDTSERNGLFIPDEINHNHKIIIQLIQLNSNGLKALLAHEFFHAIHYEINPNESSWIREGLAQVFEYMVTNELNGINLRAAIANPLTPLIGAYNLESPNSAQYGHDMLYFYYLYKHCGEEQIFWDITKGLNGLKDVELIDTILKKNQFKKNECLNFSNSAVHFEIAKIHNQIQFTQDDNQEEFFLAPTNLTPKSLIPKNQKTFNDFISNMPSFSSISIKQEIWNNLGLQCERCIVAYSNKRFPYEITLHSNDENTTNHEVIIVKIPNGKVLTDVSLKNTRK